MTPNEFLTRLHTMLNDQSNARKWIGVDGAENVSDNAIRVFLDTGISFIVNIEED